MSSDKIYAIATTYKGTAFRSRFESEVAMLLDKLDLDWQYEPKSFLLPGGHYMPDFFVPAMSLWVEARGYNGKDWQLEQFSEHSKEIGQGYIVFKSTTHIRIGKTCSGIVFEPSGGLGQFIDVSVLNGHIMVSCNGQMETVMEWPGFIDSVNFDLASMLISERLTTDLVPIDKDFYQLAMKYLNDLLIDSKTVTNQNELQVTADALKSERNSFNKIVDLRLKKVARMAIRSIRALNESVDLSGMSPEELDYFNGMRRLLEQTRETIYSKAFSTNQVIDND